MSTTTDSPASESTHSSSSPWIRSVWPSVSIGLLISFAALPWLHGYDLLGWAVTTSVWVEPGKALSTVSKAYAALGGPGSLAVTYFALLAVLTIGAAALRANVL